VRDCSSVLEEVGERLLCPRCRRPAAAWRVMPDGEVVGAACSSGLEVAPAFRDALRAALAEAPEVLPVARVMLPRRRGGRWVA
jgi:hypothetical protein